MEAVRGANSSKDTCAKRDEIIAKESEVVRCILRSLIWYEVRQMHINSKSRFTKAIPLYLVFKISST